MAAYAQDFRQGEDLQAGRVAAIVDLAVGCGQKVRRGYGRGTERKRRTRRVSNALFDFLSYGLTLSLIRRGRFGPRGQQGRAGATALWGLVDIVAAFALLVGLGLFLTVLVGVINALSAAPLLDLQQVFDDLANPAARGEYRWLILSLMTTLVPTGVHLIIVLLSAATWLPLRFKSALAHRIEDRANGFLGSVGSLLIVAGLGTTYVMGLAYVAWRLWVHGHELVGGIGLALLNSVAWLARAFGVL